MVEGGKEDSDITAVETVSLGAIAYVADGADAYMEVEPKRRRVRFSEEVTVADAAPFQRSGIPQIVNPSAPVLQGGGHEDGDTVLRANTVEELLQGVSKCQDGNNIIRAYTHAVEANQRQPMCIVAFQVENRNGTFHEPRGSSHAGISGAEGSIFNIDLEEGCVRDLNPAVAANRRAQARQRARQMQVAEDTSLPDDVAAAEEAYDEPEELFNEVGIPIEPFNLRQERQEGYFDAAGNYVEYRLDNQDAWLDTLDEKDMRIDSALAKRLAREQAASIAAAVAAGGSTVGDAVLPPPLDEDDVAIYRSRLAALLLPNETPLAALRRLDWWLDNTDDFSRPPWGLTGSAKATHRQAPLDRARPPKRRREDERGRGSTRAATAGQTSATTAAKPAAAAEADATAGTPAAGSPWPVEGGATTGSRVGGVAAEDAPAAPEVAVAAGSGAGNDTAAAAGPSSMAVDRDAGQQTGTSGSRADNRQDSKQDSKQDKSSRSAAASSVRGMGRTVPPENRPAFDRITELADLLLSVDFNVYSTTREALFKQAAETLGDVGLTYVSGGTVEAGITPRGQAADITTQGDHTASTGVVSMDLNGGDMFAEDFDASGTPVQSTIRAAAPATDAVGALGAAAASAGGAGASTDPGQAAAEGVAQPAAALEDQDALQAVTEALSSLPAGVASSGVAATGRADVAASTGGPGNAQQEQAGLLQEAGGTAALLASGQLLGDFQPVDDGGGQLLYNSDLGYYFDKRTSLFGDAATGMWYAYKDGQYELVGPADVSEGAAAANGASSLLANAATAAEALPA